MKPEVLTLTAFGPYPAEQVIDFTLLGERSLFLVHGPTGSGKSSILDGLGYALYGRRWTKDEPDARDFADMRSHQAEADRLTEVRLDFRLGAQRYRVERSPRQLRPAKRGDKMVEQAPDATLWRHRGDDADGALEVLATGARDVSDKVTDLLGFEAAQFRQVVVLPQGKFRRLLSAGSADREAILKVLFRTEHYRGIEEALKDEAKDTADRVRELRRDAERILAETEVTDRAGLDARRAELGEQAAEAEEQAAELGKERDAAGAALAAAKEVRTKLKAARQAADALAAFEESRERHAEDEARCARARRAAEPTTLLRDRDERRREAESASQALDEAAKARTDAARALEEAREALEVEEARKPEREAAAAASRATTEAVGPVEELGRLEGELAKADQAHGEAVDALHALEIRVEAAATRLRGLEEAQTAGRAVLLAATLRDGAPCPVCGSTEHPAPTMGRERVPSDRDVEEAREDSADLEKQRDAARARAADTDRRIAELSAARRAAEQRLGSLPETLAAAAGPDADELAAALEQSAPGRASERLAPLLKRIRERANSQVKALESRLAGARREAADAEQRDAAAKAAHAAAESRAAEAAELADRAAERFSAALEQSDFPDEAALGEAALPERELAVLEARIKKHNEARAAAAERARLTAEQAQGLVKADLEPLEQALAEAAERAAQADARRGALRVEREHMDKRATELDRIAGEERELEGRYHSVGRLAEVAQGRNSLRLNFHRYVLGALLDEVLAAAGPRLRLMSRGRFELRRSREVGDRRSAGGLDLLVFDSHTGTERSVNTLSGGEGFLASLSLALGLADTVQRRAGGTHLETIFVDEGFGSLDPEALDLAYRALVDLNREARLVGIVSHVRELTERVETRLEVRTGPGGSSARFVL